MRGVVGPAMLTVDIGISYTCAWWGESMGDQQVGSTRASSGGARLARSAFADSRISRRLFARRTSTWLLAGGAMAALTACGGAATQEDITALRREIEAIKAGTTDGAAADAPAHGTATATAAAGHGTADAGTDQQQHWSYEGANGPQRWAGLAPENTLCGIGANQSPIDIMKTQSGAGGRTAIHWEPAALTVRNNGHTIQDSGRCRQWR